MTAILHVTDCYLPHVGGIEMHVHDLAAHQRGSGHDARVLTSEPAEDRRPDQAWVSRVAIDSSSGLLRSVRAAHGLGEVMEEIRPDVVHVHVSVVSPFAWSAARVAARHGIPTVITMHSLWSAGGAIPAVADAALGLRRWPVLWSAVSQRATEPLRSMLGPGTPVIVLPNAVDPAEWRAVPDPNGILTVVSVMRLSPRKRPLQLARMLRQVRQALPPDIPLQAVIIGDGPQRAALQHYLARHGMTAWVDLPGTLDRASIRERFRQASVYVAPALLESFGIAALEARSAGLPVVASSRGGVGEFVQHGVDGLLVPDDTAMRAALIRLATDERLRARLTDHARTHPPVHDWANAQRLTMNGYARAADISAHARLAKPQRTHAPAGAR